MVLEVHVVLCVTVGVFEKHFFAPKIGQKYSFLNLLENLLINFFLNLVYKESLYYLLYSRTNPTLGKNLVPKISTKMLLANHITGFLN